jgi:hypothetical protein
VSYQSPSSEGLLLTHLRGEAMNKLYKPNGQEILVNDKSLEHALSLGWNDKKPAAKKKAPAKSKEA